MLKMTDNPLESLKFTVDPGTASFGEILDLFLNISDLHVMICGSGLNFTATDGHELTVSESPYELHKDTKFENKKRTFQKSLFPRYVPREQVYDSIRKQVLSGSVDELIQDLDGRFPRDSFGDNFPYGAVFGIVFNEYLRDHRRD